MRQSVGNKCLIFVLLSWVGEEICLRIFIEFLTVISFFSSSVYLHCIFSCPPLMEITLRILETFLQASRSYLSKHIQVSVFGTLKTAISLK